jgi:hypothetical protein
MKFARRPFSPRTIFSVNNPDFFVCPAFGADVPRLIARCRRLLATLEYGNALGTDQHFIRGCVLCGDRSFHGAWSGSLIFWPATWRADSNVCGVRVVYTL